MGLLTLHRQHPAHVLTKPRTPTSNSHGPREPPGASRCLAICFLSLFFFLNLEPYRLRYGLKSLDKVSSVKPLATCSSIVRPLVGPWSTTPSARPCEAARARCIRGVAGDHTGSTPPMGLSGPSGSANVGSWRVEVCVFGLGPGQRPWAANHPSPAPGPGRGWYGPVCRGPSPPEGEVPL